jgi:hypothetical protein
MESLKTMDANKIRQEYKLQKRLSIFSTEEQKIIIMDNGFRILILDNPPEELQQVAIKNNVESIYYIKNPTEAVQLEAIKRSNYIIKYIINPTDKAKQLHNMLWEV